ncbi:MAG: bifunctional UDP-N-acetylglucosamine diphosphorylase/glucosamine-1-phosphate N-acetyltransferase GlmU [Alphaproteobacteria bacterium]|nr:bifunctional UDP-N-acetylglucosamine diphosphorylase/glucosamine-1-phosphate N-acetyltransferase GlmU [Alphaproteobacteria bacterium]
MSKTDFAAIVLAAGKGSRMKSDLPKVLHPIAGRPLIVHLLDTVRSLSPAKIVVVVAPGAEAVAAAVAPATTVVQDPPLGTGDAARCAGAAIAPFDGTVLVLFGADPLVTRETLARLLAARQGANPPGLVVLGFRPTDPAQYGRLVLDTAGSLDRIVEYWDASAEEKRIRLCNSGVMAIDGARLFGWLARLDNRNAKNEYYLTDLVAIARAEGGRCAVVEAAADELTGVDSRADLAQAEAIVQRRLRGAAMANGATLVAPDTVWLQVDTKLGRDVTIEPYVVFGSGVTVEDGVSIRAHSYLEGAHIGRGAVIGPFARLRPGTTIGVDAHIGNFVEIKNAVVETGAKINHLTYVGDARVGAKANVGAGTITANYDGYRKSHTDIGAGASIGSNAVLVAPVVIGAGAVVGAGSVVTDDVPADALVVTRVEQKNVLGWAVAKRDREARKTPAKGR